MKESLDKTRGISLKHTSKVGRRRLTLSTHLEGAYILALETESR
jgi:hypothetical protein